MKSTDIFNYLRSVSKNGKILQSQVDMLYKLIEKGVTVDQIAELLGFQQAVTVEPPAPSQTQNSKFNLSQRSLDRLQGVNPSLVRVVKRAIEISEIDFMVVEGLRTKATQAEYVAKGVSKTMNSYHLTGHAVDLAPLVDGKIDWNNLNDFRKVAAAMKQAAKELKVTIEWGGDWKSFVDMPHYQIPR